MWCGEGACRPGPTGSVEGDLLVQNDEISGHEGARDELTTMMDSGQEQ
jgi:hypothetical protein